MKIFSSKTKWTKNPDNDYKFEVLNEMKDDTSRTDENCLYHTRFVFECDGISLEKQTEIANSLMEQGLSVRATFSGSKSIHTIIEFDKELEDICRDNYKEVWTACNRLFFNNEADTACANPARLTRRPDALREGGIRQKCLYDLPDNLIHKDSDTWKKIFRAVRALIASRMVTTTNEEKKDQKSFSKNNDGLCRHYDVVEYYLKKSFPKLTGNGDSSISLFKAVRCCMKYNDRQTLNEVLDKARSEKWSIPELSRIQDQIRRKYL